MTYDGKYNMFTGGDDFVKTGQINLWNDDTKVPEKMFTEHCGMLNGSAGEFFPGLDTNSIFFCFLLVKKSLICLEGKSMILHRGSTFLLLPPSKFLVSVLDP